MFSAEALDSLIKDAVKSGTPIDGAYGLLNGLTKAVLERSLQTEMSQHLGYQSGIRPGREREFSCWFDVEDGDHGSTARWNSMCHGIGTDRLSR